MEFNLANAIWLDHHFTLQDEFQRLNEEYFQTMIETLVFMQVDACVQRINSWVEAETQDRIQNFITPDDFEPQGLVFMFLLNAIYFKANWKYQFDSENTDQDNFYLSDGSAVPCHMMEIKSKFDYYADKHMQAIDLPYANEHYAMTILLPGNPAALDSLLMHINQSELNRITGAMQPDSINVFLPKLELEYEKSLVDALQSMGMQLAFGGADFSRLIQELKSQIFIKKVRQKSFLKLEETGTEAAAATVVVMMYRGDNSGAEEEIYMHIDHPFLLVIREKRSGTILFCGKIIQLERPFGDDEKAKA
ncbi:MAG: serpin family protein [candidate division KSB1 bacterium]|nr:serpin family protein [candidate division KSB1 bacterium]